MPINIDGTDISSATIDGENVSEITIDGQTVFTAIPDSDVYLHDDFEDGKLTNRDGGGITTYNGVEGVYRPEWTIDNGAPSVVDGELDYEQGDSAFAEINLNLNETITWELSNVEAITSLDQLAYFGLFYENNPVRSTSDIPPTLYPGYWISMRENGNIFRLGRVDSNGDRTTIIDTTSGSTINTLTITRSPSGFWEVFENGTSIGTATDTTYTNAQYIDFAGRSGGSDNRLIVDEIKVF